MKRWATVIACVLLGSGYSFGDGGKSPWLVQPTHIMDMRAADLGRPKDQPGFASTPLNIIVNVTGGDADSASAYGNIVFEQATDDVGDNLVPKTREGRIDLIPINRARRESAGAGFDAGLSLAEPSRKASVITSVKGHLDVMAGGTDQTTTERNFISKVGKPLDDPALKAAGLSVTVSNAVPGSTSMRVEMTGTLSNLGKVEVIGRDGKNCITSSGGSYGMGHQTSRLDLSAPVDSNMALLIHLTLGQKKVTVPFEISNIKLP